MQTTTAIGVTPAMVFHKIREQTKAEIDGIKIMKRRKIMTRQELKNELVKKGHGVSASLNAIIYLINGHEVSRLDKENLEYIEWD